MNWLARLKYSDFFFYLKKSYSKPIISKAVNWSEEDLYDGSWSGGSRFVESPFRAPKGDDGIDWPDYGMNFKLVMSQVMVFS